jgi:plastocyanin
VPRSRSRTSSAHVPGASTRAFLRGKRSPRAYVLSTVELLEARELMAMAGVDVINTNFAPNPVTIHMGDTVEWVWDSNGLSTTSVAGSQESWNSGIQNTGFTFEHTFTHVGTFSYYDVSHGVDNGNGTAGGMAGEVIVLPPSPLTMIMVTPATFSIPPNTNFSYMAMAMYADNTMEDVTADVTWSSSDSSVATVSNQPASAGLVTGVAPGNATLTASLDGMSGSTSITVTPSPQPPPISVTAIRPTQNKRHLVTGITVEFSGSLDASVADELGTYSLTRQGKKGSFDARSARAMKLKSAVYDAALDQVTLKPKKAFSLSAPVRLTIDGIPPVDLKGHIGHLNVPRTR